MITIYKIYNKINGRVYIGQTVNFKARKQYHKDHLKKRIHDNPYLQKDYNEYGLSVFIFEIIETLDNKDKANNQEDYWIDYFGGIESDSVYNCKNNIKNNKVMVYKTSATKKSQNIKLSNDTKRLIALGHKGNIPWNKDKKMSLEFKNKQSKNNKGSNNPMFGKSTKKKYTQEFINKLKEEYKEIQNIAELARLKNMNENVVRCLILYDKSYRPKQI